MRRICAVAVDEIAAALPLIDWKPSTDGWAMVEDMAGLPVQPIFDQLAGEYPGRVRGMTCFSRLIPGQFIEPHQDRHDGHCDVRVHIPIITNPGCVFIEGKQAVHMAAGFAWELNPTIRHCTANGGDSDRVHLFFNMRPA